MINPAFFTPIDPDEHRPAGTQALWQAFWTLPTGTIGAMAFLQIPGFWAHAIGNTLIIAILLGYAVFWKYLAQIPSPPPLADCLTCDASGFSTPGSGYDSVCPNCGGDRQIVIN